MPRGRGKARDVGSSFWEIVNLSGALLSRFNHARFPHIMDGARVQFIDDDHDGISEHVQSVADVDRLLGMAAANGVRFGRGARTLLGNHVVVELSRRPEARDAVEEQIGSISRSAAPAHRSLSVKLLREHGIKYGGNEVAGGKKR